MAGACHPPGWTGIDAFVPNAPPGTWCARSWVGWQHGSARSSVGQRNLKRNVCAAMCVQRARVRVLNQRKSSLVQQRKDARVGGKQQYWVRMTGDRTRYVYEAGDAAQPHERHSLN